MEELQPHPSVPSLADEEMRRIALTLIDRLDAMMAYWDHQQICVFANDAYRGWFGKTRVDMVGIGLREFLGPLYEQNLPFLEAAYAGSKQAFERDVTTSDGKVHPTLITYTPDIVAGRVQGIYVHVVDVGVIKQNALEAHPASASPAAAVAATPAPADSLEDGAHGATIGLLEDDEDQARLIAGILRSADFNVEWFDSLAQLHRNAATAARCDAMILDWSLSDGTALEVLRAPPAPQQRRIPLIVLTAHASESDTIAGLEAGADDYVTKPARPAELIARVRAALRRRAEAPSALKDLAPYVLDPQREQISVDGRDTDLTAREFAIAHYLFQRQGQAVTRKAIHSDVFRLGPQVLTRSLDTHISRLRKKLGLDGQHGFELVSIYQTGYRLRRI